MQCFECRQAGVSREAVALCHHCSAGLCAEHAVSVSRPFYTTAPINRVIPLPVKGREILCPVCHSAQAQPQAHRVMREVSPRE